MRQQGDGQFCEILNRLWVGGLTVEDEVILNTQKITKDDPNYVSTARHFFHCTKYVQNIMTCYTTILWLRKLSSVLVMLLVVAHQNRPRQNGLIFVEMSEKYAVKNGLLHEICLLVSFVEWNNPWVFLDIFTSALANPLGLGEVRWACDMLYLEKFHQFLEFLAGIAWTIITSDNVWFAKLCKDVRNFLTDSRTGWTWKFPHNQEFGEVVS